MRPKYERLRWRKYIWKGCLQIAHQFVRSPNILTAAIFRCCWQVKIDPSHPMAHRYFFFFLMGLTLSQPGYEWAAAVSSSRQTQHVYKWEHNMYEYGVFVKGFFGLGINIHEIRSTLCHGNTLPITGPLWWEFTSDRWIHIIRGRYVALRYCYCC